MLNTWIGRAIGLFAHIAQVVLFVVGLLGAFIWYAWFRLRDKFKELRK